MTAIPDRDLPTTRPVPGRTFLEHFLRNERRIYAYILALWPHRGDADDLLQEVSLFLWGQFDEADPPADFAGWACRVAYFKILDFRKRQRRSRVVFCQDVLERVAAAAADQSPSVDRRHDALLHCLQQLRPSDRDLLTHRFADGATTQSTAEKTGKSANVVYKSLAKIRDTLFDCVNRRLAAEGA